MKLEGMAIRAPQYGADAWQVFIGSNERSYTIEIKEHVREHSRQSAELTIADSENLEVFKALASVLRDMGLLDQESISTELKATKYHLEDMRKLVFKC